MIKDLYENKVGMDHKPHIKELAEKLGVPDWKVRKRAEQMGWVTPAKKRSPPWTEEEIAFVTANVRWTPHIISAKMRAAGIGEGRSASAISVYLTRNLGGLTSHRTGYTSRELSGFFGVDSQVVTRWIKDGMLDAERRGTHRDHDVNGRGGDHWWIEPKDVRRFLRVYGGKVVDARKIRDFGWVIELLSEKDEK